MSFHLSFNPTEKKNLIQEGFYYLSREYFGAADSYH